MLCNILKKLILLEKLLANMFNRLIYLNFSYSVLYRDIKKKNIDIYDKIFKILFYDFFRIDIYLGNLFFLIRFI